MKFFPLSPSTLEAYMPDGTIFVEVNHEFSWEEQIEAGYSWMGNRDDGEIIHPVRIAEIVYDGAQRFEARTPEGVRVIVRAYDEADPMRIGVSKIPWPKTVMQDSIRGDGPMALNALVDVNGDVATMMLDSPSAFYLRYDGLWVLLPDPEAIEDYDIVAVEDEALSMYDPLDQTGKSAKITSYPIKPEDDFRVQARYGGTEDSDALKPLLTESITSGGELVIPVISSARDLPAAIEFAVDHPEFRWYVERRSANLKLDSEFPW